MDIESYAASLAAETPTPGGGSAAAIVATFGAALVAMVARIVAGNQAYAAQHALANDLIAKADKLRDRSLAARHEDERAYGLVVTATALPKATADEKATRTAALQSAFAQAAAAPLAAAESAKLIATLAERALALGNPHLIGDIGSAAEFAGAALASAAINVRGNHTYLKDRDLIVRQAAQLERYERECAAHVARVRFEVGRAFARA
ncbi:MAG: cyclodeaminase/cyclohydrolase family protein [Vulcanimicrobiaceae bacterium]